MTAQGESRGFDRLRNRWGRVTPGTRDAMLAIVLTVITQIELVLASSVEGAMVVQSASFAAMTLSVAWRRTMPLFAAGLVAVGLAIQTLAGDAPVAGGFIATLIVMYSVATYAELRPALVGGAMILAAAFIYPFVADTPFVDEIVNAFLLLAPWGLGRVRRMRAKYVESETARVARDHDQHIRDVIAQERGQIARDMHDIVAHGVSMMVLQTGAARQTIETAPAKSEELLLNVEDSGRRALEELRLLLEVLKAPPSMESDATTSLNIASLADLAQRTSGTGPSVVYTVEGDQRPLPPGLEVSIYRIAQEAITNAIKHGEASRVDVVVAYGDDAVGVSIGDDGKTSPKPGLAGGGNGLIGMKERAGLFGGTVTAGPSTTGQGWLVAAELPIPQPA